MDSRRGKNEAMGISDQIGLPNVKSNRPRSLSSTPTTFFSSKINDERLNQKGCYRESKSPCHTRVAKITQFQEAEYSTDSTSLQFAFHSPTSHKSKEQLSENSQVANHVYLQPCLDGSRQLSRSLRLDASLPCESRSIHYRFPSRFFQVESPSPDAIWVD